MSFHHHLLAAVATVAAAVAQTITLPTGLAAAEGNSNNAFPWNRSSAVALRTQMIYDSSHFTLAGITQPIVITRLRWRANVDTVPTTWAGGTLANCVVEMSTAAVDYASPTTDFNQNHGFLRTVVHSGPVQFLPGNAAAPGPGPVVVDIPCTPFVYVPSLGDLLIDCQIPANSPLAGFAGTQLDLSGSPAPLASRVFNSTNGTFGTIVQNAGHVVTIDYALAQGLYPSFNANPRSGITPGLVVNFSDLSYTTGSITSWAWDLDGVPGTDSTLQNPTWTYNACGAYDVTLTVTDAAHPAGVSLLRSNFIVTDVITADFTVAQTAAPDVYTLTDTTQPPALAWAWEWDANNPGPESTLQHPTVAFANGLHTVTLTATRHCRTSTKTSSFVTAPGSLATLYAGGNSSSAGWLTFFDANVTNPLGINLSGLSINTGVAAGTPFTVRMLVTPGSFAGNDNNLAAWRVVGTASGTASGTLGTPSGAGLPRPVYLPAGSYGIALQAQGTSVALTNGNGTNQNHGNADLSLSHGATRSTYFAGGLFSTPRVWNGTLHYEALSLASASAGYGFFGAGCPTTAGPVPEQSVVSLPALGSTASVDFTNLPLNVAIHLFGFSRTSSAIGPLPLNLAGFGAPNCSGRVSPDATSFLAGTAGTANWSFAIPNRPSLLSAKFYTQALVLDTGLNALGAGVSDAWAGIVGH